MATQKSYKTVGRSMPKHCAVVETSESVRHRVFVQNFARLVNAVKTVVVEVAVKAFSKHLISENNKCDAANRSVGEYQRANDLLQVIMSRIEASDAHFDAFVAILQQLKMTKLACELKKAVGGTREDSDSGSTSGTESVDATGFKCPCGNCSLEKYFRDRSKCPELQKATVTFPYLNTSRLSEDEREILEHQLIGDVKIIKKEFQKLSDAVFEALEQNQTPVSKIKSTVFSSAEAGSSKPIQALHGDELKTITTLSDLKSFLIHYKYVIFINYEILEEIIKKHCKECQTDLDDYLQKFKDFSRRNVFEVPSDSFTSSSTPDNLLVVKIIDKWWFGADREMPDCPFTLSDIKSVQNKIAEVIKHDHRFIRLIDVGKGCIQLAFEVLSCQEPPIFPLSTSQLSEMIRCGIIVLYQPNVPSLPTNIQDTDGQTRDSTESKTISSTIKTHHSRYTVPKHRRSKLTIRHCQSTGSIPSTINTASKLRIHRSRSTGSTIDTSPKLTIRRCQSTGSIPSTIDTSSTNPQIKIHFSPFKIPPTPVPPLLVESQFTTSSKKLVKPRTHFVKSPHTDIGSMTSKVEEQSPYMTPIGDISSLEEGYSTIATSSSIVTELQEPGVHKKRYRHEELPLTMEELERRTAEKKRKIESFNYLKARYQQDQRKAEEEVRVLQSRLAQTSDEEDRRELERKIHDAEMRIKRWKEEVQQWEELINKAESELRVLNETKDKEGSMYTPIVVKPIIFPSYQPFTAPAPSPEQSQLQTLSGKKELSLRMKELEERIAGKKSAIEIYTAEQAFWQQRQREAEERVRGLQSRLTQTTDEDDRRELEKKIHHEEEEIKVCKERLQRCEEWINKAEAELLALKETKDKEQSQLQTLSGKKELSLRMEELEWRRAEKKRWIEYYKEKKAYYQQKQRAAEKEVRVLQSRLAQTTDEDDRRELERKIHKEEGEIKVWKERVQQREKLINEAEADVLTLTETKDKATESKRLLGEETSMTSPVLQTDTSHLKSSRKVPLTKPSIEPMTPPSYQPVTVAAVKPTVPSSGHSQHQTSIELPPTLETKVDFVTLEDDV